MATKANTRTYRCTLMYVSRILVMTKMVMTVGTEQKKFAFLVLLVLLVLLVVTEVNENKLEFDL